MQTVNVKTNFHRNSRDRKNHAVSNQPNPVKIYDKDGKLVKTITTFKEV